MSANAWLFPRLPSFIDPGSGLCLLLRGAYTGRPDTSAVRICVGGVTGMLRAWLPPHSHGPGRFWALVDVEYGAVGDQEVTLEVKTAAGRRESRSVETLTLRRRPFSPSPVHPGGPRIGICLATHNPPRELFRRQIDSLRRQSLGDWLTVVSDDASSPQHREMIADIVGSDPRFILAWHDESVGSYRNFERALTEIPAGVEALAFCDQDDLWAPHKLDRMLDTLPADGLACCDARVVDAEGRVLSPTFWTTRRDIPSDFTSIVIANSIPGLATMWDASLMRLILPFPPRVEHLHHDGWVAAVAAASGGVRRLSEPLVDYVQHPANALGHFAAVNPRIGRLGRRECVAALVRASTRRHVAEAQIDTALRAEALARTVSLRLRADGRTASAEVMQTADASDGARRVLAHLKRAATATRRGGLPGTELSVARGLMAARLTRSSRAGLISG